MSFARMLFPFGVTRRVFFGPGRGLRFKVRPTMGVTYALGTAVAAPREFSGYVKPGDVVYDVGANRGQMALLFGKLVGASGTVVTLEPSPNEFRELQENVALNDFHHVHPVCAAAAEQHGEMVFSYSEENTTQGKLVDVEKVYQVKGAKEFKVTTMPLDSLLEKYPAPTFMKIDIEGAAGLALRGAKEILEKARPVIYIELHGPEEQAGVRDGLQPFNYEFRSNDGEVVKDPTERWVSPLWCFPK